MTIAQYSNSGFKIDSFSKICSVQVTSKTRIFINLRRHLFFRQKIFPAKNPLACDEGIFIPFENFSDNATAAADPAAVAADNICVRHHDSAEAAVADNICGRHDNVAAAGRICAGVPNLYGRGVRFRFRGREDICL